MRSRAGNFAELLGDGIPLAQHQAGQHCLVQLLIKRKLSGEKAAVERGERAVHFAPVAPAGGFVMRAAHRNIGGRADRDHDEDDFEPFEYHGIEGGGEGAPIVPVRRRAARERGRLTLEDRSFVVKCDRAAVAQNRLAQPAQPEEEQQHAHDQLQRVDGDRP